MFDAYSMSALFAICVAVMLVAGALGVGLGARSRPGDHSASVIGTIESGLLGLLALLIGFTFSIALSRFEARKEAVLQEANAIGTAALRTQFLPAEQAAEALSLLREYTSLRIARATDDTDASATLRVVPRSLEIQTRLWQLAVAASARDPRSVSAGLLVQSLNDMIDMHEKRLTAIRNHVPDPVFVMLLIFGAAVSLMLGYDAGRGVRRFHGLRTMTVVLLAGVFVMIVDLDRPRRGFITVSQQPLLDTLQGMPAAP